MELFIPTEIDDLEELPFKELKDNVYLRIVILRDKDKIRRNVEEDWLEEYRTIEEMIKHNYTMAEIREAIYKGLIRVYSISRTEGE